METHPGPTVKPKPDARQPAAGEIQKRPQSKESESSNPSAALPQLTRGVFTRSSTRTDDDSTQKRLQYQPLDQNRQEIRILRLYYGYGDAPVRGSLHVVTLTEDPPPWFFALSYVWGDPKDVEDISIDGCTFSATRNLVAALKRIRREDGWKPIWADAVCINQEDIQERNHQVTLMKMIYQHAKRVLIHLDNVTEMQPYENKLAKSFVLTNRGSHHHGDGAILNIGNQFDRQNRLVCPQNSPDEHLISLDRPPIANAVAILEQLALGKHFHELPFYRIHHSTGVVTVSRNQAWQSAIEALGSLLRRPWWSRLWVLQEAILPQVPPLVLFGDYELSFEVFLAAYDYAWRHAGSCCLQLRGILASRGWLVLDPLLHFWALNDNLRRPSSSLFGILRSGSVQCAGVLHDRIYGLLGFMHNLPHQIIPDYQMPVEDLWFRATCLVIEMEGHLEFLYPKSLSYSPKTAKTPSWCIDMDKPLIVDSFMLVAEACCSHCESASSKPRLDKSLSSLSANALRLGTILEFAKPAITIEEQPENDTSVKVKAVHREILQHIEHCVQWGAAAGRDRADSTLWKAIVFMYFNLDAFGKDPKLYDKLIKDWETTGLALGSPLLPSGMLWGMKARITRGQGYRLFITDTGYLGVTWLEETQVGDCVYNLATSRAPVILRKADRQKGSNCFEFVSCAYVPELEHCGCVELDTEEGVEEIVLV